MQAAIEFFGLAQGMGDHQQRSTRVTNPAHQQIKDGVRAVFIKVTGGLIRQHQFRACRQGPRNGDALLLTAGQLFWVARQMIGKSQMVRQFRAPLTISASCQTGVKSDISGDVQRGDQVELLEDYPNLTPTQIGAGGIIHLRQIVVLKPDGPAIGRVQTGH